MDSAIGDIPEDSTNNRIVGDNVSMEDSEGALEEAEECTIEADSVSVVLSNVKLIEVVSSAGCERDSGFKEALSVAEDDVWFALKELEIVSSSIVDGASVENRESGA